MSEPESVRLPSDTTPTPAQPAPTPAPPLEMSVEAAIQQLRTLVCVLGGVLVVVSLALTAFVWKQNRTLGAAASSRREQAIKLQGAQQQLTPAILELEKASADNKELLAIFARHGIAPTAVTQTSAPTAASAPTP